MVQCSFEDSFFPPQFYQYVLKLFLLIARNKSTCNVGNLSSITGLGRFPGKGNGYPLQYSCLENPMDRGAWWATIHGVTKSWTRWRDSLSLSRIKHLIKKSYNFMAFNAKIWEICYQWLSRKMYTRVTSFCVFIDTYHYYCN